MPRNKKITCISFSPDGRYLASGKKDLVSVYDVETEEKIREFMSKGFNDIVIISPSGELLATGTWNNKIIWHVRSGKQIMNVKHEYSVHPAMSYMPDGRFIVIITADSIDIWDIKTTRKIHDFFHAEYIFSVAVSPDGKYIATGRDYGSVVIQDTRSKNVFKRHDGLIGMVVFSHDGILAICDYKGNMEILDWREKRLIKGVSGRNRRYILSWFKRALAWNDNNMLRFPFAEFKSENITAVALSRRGFLAIGHYDGTIEVIRE